MTPQERSLKTRFEKAMAKGDCVCLATPAGIVRRLLTFEDVSQEYLDKASVSIVGHQLPWEACSIMVDILIAPSLCNLESCTDIELVIESPSLTIPFKVIMG